MCGDSKEERGERKGSVEGGRKRERERMRGREKESKREREREMKLEITKGRERERERERERDERVYQGRPISCREHGRRSFQQPNTMHHPH